MSEDSPLPRRLRAGSSGLGAANASDIESRALELARSDGRTEVSESDLDRAADELSGADAAPPDPNDSTFVVEKLVGWDEPIGSEGSHGHENQPDDEQSVAEQLIEQGMQEADHDSRVAATEDEDEFEPQ